MRDIVPDRGTQPASAGERFEALLELCERRRVRSLSFDDLRDLAALYRAHTVMLARLRDRNDDPDAIRHVNALCVRAYALLYAPARRARPLASLRARLPELVARTWRVQVVAWVLLLGGMLLGAGLARRDPLAVHALIPQSLGYSDDMLDRLVTSPQERARFLAREETPAAENAVFGSFLFVHNTRVGLLSFATGMLAGIPTVLLQLYNGLLLGAFFWIFCRDPLPLRFLAWVLPHAIPELTAITLCASAGLVFGEAIALPGRRSRRTALREAASPALLLFTLSVPFFFVAALIESFVRESQLSTSVRLAIAAASVASLACALGAVRRLARRAGVETAWLRELSARARGESPGSGRVPPR